MNPDKPLTPDEEREIRLTALLMGELSDKEAEAVRADLENNPELKALYERLEKAFELLREASSLSEAAAEAAPARLSSERREKLLAHFKRAPIPGAAVIQKPNRRWEWLGPLAWGGAFVLLLGMLGIQKLGGLASSSREVAYKRGEPSAFPFSTDSKDFVASTNGAYRRSLAAAAATPAPPAEALSRETQPSFRGGYYAGKPSASFNDQGVAGQSPAPASPAAPPPPPAPIVAWASQPGAVRPYPKNKASKSPADEETSKLAATGGNTQGGAITNYRFDAEGDSSKLSQSAKVAEVDGLLKDGKGQITLSSRAPLPQTAQSETAAAKKLPEDATDALRLAGSASHEAKDRAEGERGRPVGSIRDLSGSVASSTTSTPAANEPENVAILRKAIAEARAGQAESDKQVSKLAEELRTVDEKDRADIEAALAKLQMAIPGGIDLDAAEARLEALSRSSNRDLSGFDPTVVSGPTVASAGALSIAPAKPVTGEQLDGAKVAAQEPMGETPTLGDIPLAGRLFAKQTLKLPGANTFTGKESFEGVINYGTPIAGEGKGGVAGGEWGADSLDSRANLLSKLDGKWELEKGKLAKADGTSLTGKDLELKPESQDEANMRLAPPVDDAISFTGTLKNQLQTESSKKQAEIQKAEPVPQPDAPASRPAPSPLIPQPEVTTSANAFSTFSLNVSDVAFKLAAASLEQGNMPEATSMRSEEFINAFDYRDPQPVPGAPLAFASERARYPFAQNRDLLRLSIKTAAAGREPGRALNLVLVLDNSGSMERADRVHIVKESLRVLATQLQPQDKLSIITFSRTPRLWIDGAPGNQAVELTSRVGEITPEGGTNLDAALNLAYQTAHKHYDLARINRVVLLTDGAANLGDVNPAELKRKVEAQRKQGIALDCFGVGWEGYNDDLLEQLSRNGDGRYGFINSPEEASTEFAAQLAGALRVAASDVKVQIEFNPRRVTAYRQIGYAKHQLTKEQFRDNTVDAAEIGAAESGNALYVIEVNPRGEGDLATVRARFRVPGTSDYREHEWTVPFTPSVPALEQASPAMRLAATASAFSEWLAGNPYAAEVTSDRLLGIINGVPGTFSPDPRPGKLEWMIRQAKSIKGN